MKYAIFLSIATILTFANIYARKPVVINNDDYIVCSQQKIKDLNWKICREFNLTYWTIISLAYISNSVRQALFSMIGNCCLQIISS